MKTRLRWALCIPLALSACDKTPTDGQATANDVPAAEQASTADNLPPLDPTNIVSIASGSPDHTTLVKALKAANYVTAVASPGPFTVFAPTNAAFAKLPKGTLEGLLQPGKQEDLRNVLKYHVTTSMYPAAALTDGLVLAMANGAKTTVHAKDGKITIGDANVIATIPGSNGVVHVIDAVLLPPAS